jgi:hypothetical protein
MRIAITLFLSFVVAGHSFSQEKLSRALRMKKKHQYEHVDFENLIRRYFEKESSHSAEGIYSVSCVITKRYKALFTGNEKEKVIERKDNYARVAILKDLAGTNRDFIEVSLSYRDANKYPIIGSMNSVADGPGYIYHHIEPNGYVLTFSIIGESAEILQGEFTKMEGRKEITYKLSYIKIFPKNQAVVISN